MKFTDVINALRGDTTTGLDVLAPRPDVVTRVVEKLFYDDNIPATYDDVTTAFITVTGSSPSDRDRLDVIHQLESFGW